MACSSVIYNQGLKKHKDVFQAVFGAKDFLSSFTRDNLNFFQPFRNFQRTLSWNDC